jgi:hypothetical protein
MNCVHEKLRPAGEQRSGPRVARHAREPRHVMPAYLLRWWLPFDRASAGSHRHGITGVTRKHSQSAQRRTIWPPKLVRPTRRVEPQLEQRGTVDIVGVGMLLVGNLAPTSLTIWSPLSLRSPHCHALSFLRIITALAGTATYQSFVSGVPPSARGSCVLRTL